MGIVKKRLYYLKHIFDNSDEFNINNNNINYIYFKIPEWCCNYTPKPLFTDIEPFGWNKMINIIKTVYESKKESDTKFFETIPDYKKETLTINDNCANEMILYYIKCRPKIKILTQFSNNKLDFSDCYLYAKKTIKLSTNAIEVLIYQLFCLTNKFKNYNEIHEYVKLINSDTCKIYVYEEKSEISFIAFQV